MTGKGTFSGTDYQARLVALTYVHVLGQARLGWLPPHDDTPVAVSGETGGPGDDIGLELAAAQASIEVQAKHGLTAGVELVETISAIAVRSAGSEQKRVLIVVNRASTKKLTDVIARDLDTLRSGRTAVSQNTRDLQAKLAANSKVL